MTALIGVDWGTTNLRAFRFDADGAVIERRAGARGASTLAPADFASVLVEIAGDWTDGAVPIVLAGMVGSRAGWREAPYLPCPAEPSSLAAAALLIETPLGSAAIVPGLSARRADGSGDVMRGEETQLLGAAIPDGTVVLPGTHSKWAEIAGGRIVGIGTAMTGELYALLRSHSLLGRLAVTDAPFDAEAFALGTTRALETGTLVPLLFSARADVLLGDLREEAVESYLSGLLVGGEVAAFGRGSVTLVGGEALMDRYALAIDLAGLGPVVRVDGEHAAARGLWMIGAEL